LDMQFWLRGFYLPPADYWDRMETLVGLEEEQDNSLDLRKDFIRAGVIIVLDDPALGVGMGNFGKAMVAADPMFSALDPNSVAHNMYLEFFAENGIIAGLLFVGLLGIAVLQSIRHDKRSKSEYSVYGLGFCVATSLLAMMTSGLFLSQGKHSVLWFLIGLGIAFQVMARSRKQPPVTRYTNKLVDY